MTDPQPSYDDWTRKIATQDMRTNRRIFGEATKALKSGDLVSAGQLLKQLLIACGDQHDGFYYDVLYHAGLVTSGLGHHHWASVIFEDVVKHQPTHFFAHYNAGVCYQRLGRLAKAKDAFAMAAAIRPNNLLVLVNSGNVLMAMGEKDEALARFNRALAVDSKTPDELWVKATVLLSLNRWREGWAAWEQRWNHPAFLAQNRRHFFATHPRWAGAPLGAKCLLIHPEQGMGDSIMFARHLARLRAEHPKAHLVLETHGALVTLFRRSFGHLVDDIRAHAMEGLPAFDTFISLGSLSTLYEDEGQPVPPYLIAPTTIAPPADRLRLGFTWRGQPGHNEDKHRTIPLPLLAPLLEAAPDAEWVAIQRDDVSQQEVTALNHPRLRWVADALNSFEDTAAWIRSCDYVISVDSATVHVAGALGVPTIMLNRAMCDWRWGAVPRIGSTGWYQSLIEVRQRQYGDWSEVIGTVAETLRHLTPPAGRATPVPAGPPDRRVLRGRPHG